MRPQPPPSSFSGVGETLWGCRSPTHQSWTAAAKPESTTMATNAGARCSWRTCHSALAVVMARRLLPPPLPMLGLCASEGRLLHPQYEPIIVMTTHDYTSNCNPPERLFSNQQAQLPPLPPPPQPDMVHAMTRHACCCATPHGAVVRVHGMSLIRLHGGAVRSTQSWHSTHITRSLAAAAELRPTHVHRHLCSVPSKRRSPCWQSPQPAAPPPLLSFSPELRPSTRWPRWA